MRRFAPTLPLLRLLAGLPAAAQDAPGPIQDNSFLLEEAYNQEDHVVQHISAFLRSEGGDWVYTFTQEWPVKGQRHQLSYSLPVAAFDDGAGRSTGLGDVAVNYRFQAVGSGQTRVAFSPRLSVLLPTGSHERGRGAGSGSLQLNLPLSLVLADRLVAHSNAGLTWTGSAKDPAGDEADASAVNLGQSLIWLAHPRFNVMLELSYLHLQGVVGPGRTEWTDSLLLSPGVRWAWNFANELQVVPGVAVPIGIGPSSGEVGVFAYLSFEHPFGKRR